MYLFLSHAIFLLKRKDQDKFGNNKFPSCCSGLVLVQPHCAVLSGPGGVAPTSNIRHLMAILTVSEEDVGSPVLRSRWVLEVINERTDRLEREKEGNEFNFRGE